MLAGSTARTVDRAKFKLITRMGSRSRCSIMQVSMLFVGTRKLES
jgi:hypothetical protein